MVQHGSYLLEADDSNLHTLLLTVMKKYMYDEGHNFLNQASNANDHFGAHFIPNLWTMCTCMLLLVLNFICNSLLCVSLQFMTGLSDGI